MGSSPQKPVSPIEIAIFTAVLGLFAFSSYRFIHESPTLPEGLQSEDTPRQPSSIHEPNQNTSAFYSLKIDCTSPDLVQDTQASKLRLMGHFCNTSAVGTSTESKPLTTKAYVVNQTTRYTATVFVDNNSGKYSTDYIPLQSGLNEIKVQVVDGAGKRSDIPLKITRK